MDTLDDSLQYNLTEQSGSQSSEEDEDTRSVSSGESFEAIPDTEGDDDENENQFIPTQPRLEEIQPAETREDSSSSSSYDESPTYVSMMGSEIEVLESTAGTESMTQSDYVMTASLDASVSNEIAEESAGQSRGGATNEELAEVVELIDSFIKPISEQNAADGIEVIDVDESNYFPNLNGAGDHEALGRSLDTLQSQPTTVVTTSGAAKLEDLRAFDEDDSDDDEDFEDETLAERLWGLTEMFPETVRNGSSKIFDFSIASTKFCYTWSRKTLWVVTTGFIILYLPIAIETERMAMEKEGLNQAQDVLLGANKSEEKSFDHSAPPMPNVPLTA